MKETISTQMNGNLATMRKHIDYSKLATKQNQTDLNLKDYSIFMNTKIIILEYLKTGR